VEGNDDRKCTICHKRLPDGSHGNLCEDCYNEVIDTVALEKEEQDRNRSS
jgi:hypothetical protein